MAFSAEKKLEIVFAGLAEGNSITDICAKYDISRQTFYDWKNQLIEGAKNSWNAKQAGRKGKNDVTSLSEAKEKIKKLQQKQEKLAEQLKQANKEKAIQKLKKEHLKFQLTEDDIDPEIKAKNIKILKKSDFPLDTNNGS